MVSKLFKIDKCVNVSHINVKRNSHVFVKFT